MLMYYYILYNKQSWRSYFLNRGCIDESTVEHDTVGYSFDGSDVSIVPQVQQQFVSMKISKVP